MTQHEREQMFSKEDAQAQWKRDLEAQIAEKARRKQEAEEKEQQHQVCVYAVGRQGRTHPRTHSAE